MQIYLDPWNPEFGSSLQAETPDEGAPPQIKLNVEVAEWKPIKPDPVDSDFIFVDGVRRVESRIILQNGKIMYGVFGSTAAGAVRMRKNFMNVLGENLLKTEVGRYLVTGGGSLPFEQSVRVHPHLEFLPVSVSDESVQAPMQKLQQLMRDAEGKILETIAKSQISDDELIVADGPLHFPWARGTPAVGYIKSFHEWYLPQPLIPSLGKLCVSERTPIFRIEKQGAQFPDRFSWFVRLSDPGKGDSPVSGLARLEAACDSGLEKARTFANRSCGLTTFVAKKYRDPRSPQNLLPIGALEKNLKRLMGDSLIVQRWIQSFLLQYHTEAAPAVSSSGV